MSKRKFVSVPPKTPTIEPLLLTTARVSTFDGRRLLTGASGFFLSAMVGSSS